MRLPFSSNKLLELILELKTINNCKLVDGGGFMAISVLDNDEVTYSFKKTNLTVSETDGSVSFGINNKNFLVKVVVFWCKSTSVFK